MLKENMTKEDWIEFYSRKEQFCRLFHDQAFLEHRRDKGTLKEEEVCRLEAVDFVIGQYLNS